MNVLVYAFKKFGEDRTNISQEVLEGLKYSKISKILFPVEFNKNLFKGLIQKNPRIIIGLGQCPRGKKIRIERRSKNIFGLKNSHNYKPISKTGPKILPVNLILKPVRNSWISYNAGKHVCNYSMYILTDLCARKGIKFAFLHIPKKIEGKEALKSVMKFLNQLNYDEANF